MTDTLPHLMVFGSRQMRDYDLVRETLDRLVRNMKRGVVVVTGEWRGIGLGTPNYVGADLLAEQWAQERGFGYRRFPPEFEQFPGGWAKKAPGAFHKRNRDMVNFIASLGPKGMACGFWDGVSPGTRSVIELLEKAKVRHKVVRYQE